MSGTHSVSCPVNIHPLPTSQQLSIFFLSFSFLFYLSLTSRYLSLFISLCFFISSSQLFLSLSFLLHNYFFLFSFSSSSLLPVVLSVFFISSHRCFFLSFFGLNDLDQDLWVGWGQSEKEKVREAVCIPKEEKSDLQKREIGGGH